jgi:hypothetical protein
MKERMETRKLRTALKVFLLGAMLAGSVLQLQTGLADNGDFTRLMLWMTSGPEGFSENWILEGDEGHEQRFFESVLMFWKLDTPMSSRWVGSILLVWIPGVLLNLLLYSTDVLYLPFISFAPRAFLLLFLWLLLRWIDREVPRLAPMLYLVLGLPLVFIGFNTEYVVYFSSLYQEPASLIGLLLIVLSIAYYSGKDDSRWRPWISAAAVLFMTTAKLSNIHWALLGMLLLVPWKTLRHSRQRLAVYVVLIGIAPIGFSLLQVTQYNTSSVNAYQSIFCGALMFSDDPADQLQQLGMPDGEKYIGRHAYCDEGREAMRRYPDRLNHRSVLEMLLREPSIACDMMLFAADSMQITELTHLSKSVVYNDPHAQQPWPRFTPMAASSGTPLNSWSRLKRSVFPTGAPLIGITVLLLAFFVWLRRSRGRALRTIAAVGVLLTLGVLSDMWMQIFGDGQRDLIKHLFLSNICFDGALITALAAGIVKFLGGKR